MSSELIQLLSKGLDLGGKLFGGSESERVAANQQAEYIAFLELQSATFNKLEIFQHTEISRLPQECCGPLIQVFAFDTNSGDTILAQDNGALIGNSASASVTFWNQEFPIIKAYEVKRVCADGSHQMNTLAICSMGHFVFSHPHQHPPGIPRSVQVLAIFPSQQYISAVFAIK